MSTAQNRTSLARAAWTAEGCLARARVVIDGALGERAAGGLAQTTGWRALDRIVATALQRTAPGCEVTLRAAGSSLDVNEADAELLRALCWRLRLPEPQADSLVDALLDWRDADDVPRPVGAERVWYTAHRRPPPRNGPVADRRELRLVRGMDAVPALAALLDVEPGRIDLNHAPLAVLGALPGFTDETIARMAERRARGVPTSDLMALGGQLSPTARQQLLARYAELARRTTPEPDAWIARSRAHAGAAPVVTAVLEVRLVRAGRRAALVRRRTWVE